MSPRKTILRELSQRYETEGEPFARASSLPGFESNPEQYQKTVNSLLQDRLIEGRKDDDGHMAVAVNAHRIADVQKELRPTWRHPGIWAFVAIVVLAAAGFVA